MLNKKLAYIIIASIIVLGIGVTTYLIINKPAPETSVQMEKPLATEEKPAVEKPTVEKPTSGKPTEEKPSLEKPSLQKPEQQTATAVQTTVDQTAVTQEPVILNGDHCWRDDNHDGNWRRCSNMIINPGMDPNGPIPAVGDWITGTDFDSDRQNNSSSKSLKLSGAANAALNDEYNEHFQPLYSAGVYEFSFWIKEDAASAQNNDWTVRLKIRDWWQGGNMPAGARRCYGANNFIRRIGSAVNQWQRYAFTFNVPIQAEQWNEDISIWPEGCIDNNRNPIQPYDPATIIPSGYAIIINGNSNGQMQGNIWLDDFALVRK